VPSNARRGTEWWRARHDPCSGVRSSARRGPVRPARRSAGCTIARASASGAASRGGSASRYPPSGSRSTRPRACSRRFHPFEAAERRSAGRTGLAPPGDDVSRIERRACSSSARERDPSSLHVRVRHTLPPWACGACAAVAVPCCCGGARESAAARCARLCASSSPRSRRAPQAHVLARPRVLSPPGGGIGPRSVGASCSSPALCAWPRCPMPGRSCPSRPTGSSCLRPFGVRCPSAVAVGGVGRDEVVRVAASLRSPPARGGPA
jgi:hypothetical protein